MRLIVVLAGAFGFITAMAGSLSFNKPLEISMVNGIVSALVAGLLLRWWMKIWISCLEQVSREDAWSEQQAQTDDEVPQ